jgi:hypothetical protein
MNHAVATAFWIPIFFLLVLLATGLVAYLLGYFNPPRQ